MCAGVSIETPGQVSWLAQPAARAASGGRIEFMIALAFALAGHLVLISNRGRHLAWIALWLVALLVGLGI